MRHAYAGCGHRGFHRGEMFRNTEMFRHANMFRRQPPVNITENPDAFIIEVFAPAMTKDMFKITTQNDVLSIRYTPNADSGESYRHQEYRLKEFERSFDLKGKVNLDGISARYEEGILRVTLPKTDAAKRPARDIPVNA